MDGFFKKLLNRFIYPTSLIFTVISLAVFSMFLFFGEEDVQIKPKATAVLFFILFIYSAFAAFVSLIFYTKMIMSIKLPSHFLALFIPYYIGIKYVFETTYIRLIISFVALYAVIATVILILTAKKRNKKRDNKEYKKLYSE